MDNLYECVYYATASGRIPAEDFINSLSIHARKKFFATVELLSHCGKKLPSPHAKYLGEDIYELRFSGQEGAIRVLYFFYHQRKIILTNGFIKKSNQTPEQEKHLAIQRRKDYFNRFSAGEKP